MKPISRRTVLRGAGSVAIALPWLEAMAPRKASAALSPRRFVAMFQPMGSVFDNWRPSGTETAFQLSPILSPLEAHKKDLVVIEGLDQKGDGGGGHQIGIGGLLTGQTLNPGPFRAASGELAGWAAGPSIDQEIAKVIAGDTKFRSREFGVFVRGATNNQRMCYAAADQPLAPESSPANALKTLFGDLSSDAASLAMRAQRRTVLDAVLGQYRSLRQRLGTADGVRLDQHLSALREIEVRLNTVVTVPAICQKPTVDPGLKLTDPNVLPAVMKAQMDILIMALACDLTRVTSLQWVDSTANTRFSWLGINDGHHSLSHLPDSDPVAKDKMVRINRWFGEQFAYLIDGMKKIQEGDRTLFDNSLLFWGNGLAKGNSHSLRNAPYVLAGSAGGRVRTGRYLRYTPGIPHNNLLVSMANAMGSPITTFGKPDWCTGPLRSFA